MELTVLQWAISCAAGVLVGISKTGVPGVGILVVPLLANVFGGRPSVGIMLPMLIFADLFAVTWYRRHAQWDKIIRLAPWVAVGFGLAYYALQTLGKKSGGNQIMDIMIGALVLVMLAIHLLRNKFGDALAPKSFAGIASTGTAAGFATSVSNAAGPVMSIYFAALKLNKEQFVGTAAWFFFIVNVTKLPMLFQLSIDNPENPIITLESLKFLLYMIPSILAGVFFGKWLMPRISQKAFNGIILSLAGVSAAYLIYGAILKLVGNA